MTDDDSVRSVDAALLHLMDDMRDYGAASTFNWLNARVDDLLDFICAGGTVRVAAEEGLLTLSSADEVKAWAEARYPGTTFRSASVLGGEVISLETLRALDKARDSGVQVQSRWLERRLRRLFDVAYAGERIEVEQSEPTGGYVPLCSVDEYLQWARERFGAAAMPRQTE